jgi:hypothetical protein
MKINIEVELGRLNRILGSLYGSRRSLQVSSRRFYLAMSENSLGPPTDKCPLISAYEQIQDVIKQNESAIRAAEFALRGMNATLRLERAIREEDEHRGERKPDAIGEEVAL